MNKCEKKSCYWYEEERELGCVLVEGKARECLCRSMKSSFINKSKVSSYRENKS